jgi:transposase InsO family protein
LTKTITKIFDLSEGRYGSPRVHAALRNSGILVSRKRVARLMRGAKLRARVTLVTRRMPGLKRFVNRGQNKLLNFGDTSGCDQIWVADVTYIKLHGIWTYLATIMDRHSRRILGWSLSYNRTTELTVTALKYALRKTRNAKGVILHTDRGVEFTGSAFQSELAKAGLEHSVNRPGHCTDNAYMEAFYHSLKGELIRKAVFRGFTHLHRALARYINSFYNKVRLHSGLGYRSPIDDERMAA